MPREHHQVHYKGRVQGVGFRLTTRDVARKFAVAGYVQNLPDGRVLVVVEGDAGELHRFWDAVEAAMEGNITSRELLKKAPTESFRDFAIRK